MNPGSELHDPSFEDLKAEEQTKGEILGLIHDIEDELRNPTQDPYSGEDSSYRAIDPEEFWERLARVREEELPQITDRTIHKQLEQRIKKLEGQIYQHYVPFIDAQINLYGYHESPLEKHARPGRINLDELQSYFRGAELALEHYNPPAEDKQDFKAKLERLQQKFERYQSEPVLATFERVEDEIQTTIRRASFMVVPSIERIDDMIGKAHHLIEIAHRILNGETRDRYTQRARGLLSHLEWTKEAAEAPRDKQQRPDEPIKESKGIDWAWSLLGVNRGANKKDVRAAYRKLAQEFHPDINKSPEAESTMKRINEAYEQIEDIEGWKKPQSNQ